MPKILISGYFGMGNIGDEALLSSLIGILRNIDASKIEISVLSGDPLVTTELYGVLGIDRRSMYRVLKAIEWADIVITGPGGLIQDVTSFRSLLYYIGIAAMTKFLGKKSLILGCGVGPVNRGLGRALTKKITKKLDGIALRDMPSLEELRRYGLKRHDVKLFPDFGLLVDASSSMRGKELLEIEGIPYGNYPLIGMAVRPVGIKEVDYELKKLLAITADALINKYSAHIVFLPFDTNMDKDFSISIQAMMKNHSFLIQGQYRPSDIKGIINELNLMIGMRLHSLILSCTSNIPVVGIAYDPKVENFLVQIGSYDFINLKEVSEQGIFSLAKNAMTLGSMGQVNYSKEKVHAMKEKVRNESKDFLLSFL